MSMYTSSFMSIYTDGAALKQDSRSYPMYPLVPASLAIYCLRRSPDAVGGTSAKPQSHNVLMRLQLVDSLADVA